MPLHQAFVELSDKLRSDCAKVPVPVAEYVEGLRYIIDELLIDIEATYDNVDFDDDDDEGV